MDRTEDVSAHGAGDSELAEALPHDVTERPERPTTQWRGKRLTIGAVLALLVAGVGGGVGVGAAAASGGQRPAGGVRILVPESQTGAGSSGAFSSSSAAPVMTAAPCRARSGKATSSNSASAVCVKEGSSTGTAPGVFFGSSQETASHVLTRTSSGGITIRVYRQSLSEPQCPPLPVGLQPGTPLSAAGSAAPSSSQAKEGSTSSLNDYTLDFSDAAAVGQGGLFDGQAFATAGGISTGGSSASGASTEASSKLVPAIATGTFGWLEGSPAWWVAAIVGPSVARAEVTFAGGARDSMAPVGGFISLAAPIERSVASSKPGPWAVRGTLRLLAVDGSILATIDLAPSPVPLPIAKPPLPGTVVPQGVAGGSSVSGSSVSGSSVSGGAVSGGSPGGASSSPASSSGSGGTATPTSSSSTTTTGYSGAGVACPMIGSSGSGSAIPPQGGVPSVTATGA